MKPNTVRKLKVKELKSELDLHCISGANKNTFELLECLVNHYAEKDHFDQKKWDQKMVTEALKGLKPKAKGRKRKLNV